MEHFTTKWQTILTTWPTYYTLFFSCYTSLASSVSQLYTALPCRPSLLSLNEANPSPIKPEHSCLPFLFLSQLDIANASQKGWVGGFRVLVSKLPWLPKGHCRPTWAAAVQQRTKQQHQNLQHITRLLGLGGRSLHFALTFVFTGSRWSHWTKCDKNQRHVVFVKIICTHELRRGRFLKREWGSV